MPLPKEKPEYFLLLFPFLCMNSVFLLPHLLLVLTWTAPAGSLHLRLLSQLSSSIWRLFAAASPQCPYNCHKLADAHLSSQLTEGEWNATEWHETKREQKETKINCRPRKEKGEEKKKLKKVSAREEV